MSDVRLYADLESSLWRNNPMLVHLLGITPLVAVSDSATKALALGIGMLLVGLVSAFSLWGVRKYISPSWRLLVSAVTLSAYCSLLALLLQLFFYPLYRELGIYVFLIPCNFALLLKMDNIIRTDELAKTGFETFVLGLSLMLALVSFALVREFVLAGSVFYGWQLLIPGAVEGGEWMLENRENLFTFNRLQPAGFLLLGLCLALLRFTKSQDSSPIKQRNQHPVERARVTGRLKNIKEN